jgi:hypothetical protein
VSEGQRLDGVDFVLPPMGSITGRILDDSGEPMAGVVVWAMRPIFFEGRRQLAAASSGGFRGTDDTGEYRLTGLPPGSYYIRATTRETWMVANNGVREPMGFTPTYFPGTIELAQARLVDVGVGQQVRVTDLFLVPGRPATISGRVFDSKGLPLAGRSVSLSQRTVQVGGGGGFSAAGSALVGADGSFVLRDVSPGEYDVSVSTGNFRTGDGEAGRLPVIVDGSDIDDLVLTTTAGWSIEGRILTEDGMPPTFTPAQARIEARPLTYAPDGGAGNSETRADWTFSLEPLAGPIRLSASVPDGWMVRTIRRSDRDLSESPVEMKSGERLTDVEVVVTTRVTAVRGQLNDERGTPISGGTVLVFAEDARKWGEGSRFVRAERPDQQGVFEVKALPPGDYLAVALDYLEDNAWNDPEYLESLRTQADRFTLGDGGAHTLALRLAAP